MKKFAKFLSLTILLGAVFMSAASAKSADTKDWYQYNGYTQKHPFTIKFPKNWKVKTLDESIQKISPDTENSSGVIVQEFSSQTYDGVINYFVTNDLALIKVEDFLLPSIKGDIIGKKAAYQKKSSGESLTATFLKRGSELIVIIEESEAIHETYNQIVNSFYFSDSWVQYIDEKNKLTFIYPIAVTTKINYNIISLHVPTLTEPIFTITLHQNSSLDIVKEKKEEIVFNGYEKAVRASFTDLKSNKKYNKIFVEKNGNVYELSDINVESDFPHPDYYDQYVAEILDSFELFDFDLEGQLNSYQNFTDVEDQHANAKAINTLFKDKIINGYEDGTFKPDGEINRAELTKMIVAARATPSLNIYNNCFPDVQKEWFAPYICYAKEKGWVSGYADGTFKPNASVTRVEALKIIIGGFYNGKIPQEALKDTSVTDIKISDWYGKYFIFADNRSFLDKQHVVKSGKTYHYLPLKNITRKEVAETIYRIKNPN